MGSNFLKSAGLLWVVLFAFGCPAGGSAPIVAPEGSTAPTEPAGAPMAAVPSPVASADSGATDVIAPRGDSERILPDAFYAETWYGDGFLQQLFYGESADFTLPAAVFDLPLYIRYPVHVGQPDFAWVDDQPIPARLVFWPDGAMVPKKYIDAKMTSRQAGGRNVSFTALALGPGRLQVFLYMKEASFPKPADFSEVLKEFTDETARNAFLSDPFFRLIGEFHLIP